MKQLHWHRSALLSYQHEKVPPIPSYLAHISAKQVRLGTNSTCQRGLKEVAKAAWRAAGCSLESTLAGVAANAYQRH